MPAAPLPTLSELDLQQQLDAARPLAPCTWGNADATAADGAGADAGDSDEDAPSVWHKRKLGLNQNWEARRPMLLHATVAQRAVPEDGAVCATCDGPAAVSCVDCSPGQSVLSCALCDRRAHPGLHFRRCVWGLGYLEPISMSKAFTEERQMVSTGESTHD